MRRNVIVLNSGGFDSMCLLNHVYNSLEKNADIISLHFTYGELNSEQQELCVDKACKKLGVENICIDLPAFDWTNGNFYEDDTTKDLEQCYLEWRNLVFLSYAVSVAESKKADSIYLATLKGTYCDTSKTMFDGLNSFLTLNGIKIVAPFSELTKQELFPYAVKYRLQKGDYFSCDVPVDGKPCGECGDCKSLVEIEKALTIDHHYKAYLFSGRNVYSDLYKETALKHPIYEIRALINNECQLNCKHCFYGFDEMAAPPISKEAYMDILEEAVVECGIKNIHFSGKEPLFNDDILYYASEIKRRELPCTFNLVTNGINVPKYAKKLKEYGVEHIMLSVDEGILRKTNKVVHEALKECMLHDIKVTLFYDLYRDNKRSNAGSLFYTLYPLLMDYKCIDSVFIRTVRSIGSAENNVLLTEDDLLESYKQVSVLSDLVTDAFYEFTMSLEYTWIEHNKIFGRILNQCDAKMDNRVKSNLSVMLERYCSRYLGTITLTPDGYILGCASEVACKDYYKIAAGNVKNKRLKDCIFTGKCIAQTCNDCYKDFTHKKCSFLYQTT